MIAVVVATLICFELKIESKERPIWFLGSFGRIYHLISSIVAGVFTLLLTPPGIQRLRRNFMCKICPLMKPGSLIESFVDK